MDGEWTLIIIILIAAFILGLCIGWLLPPSALAEVQCLENKPFYQHIHVLVQGIKIPANVGIDPTTGCIREIHTHDNKGVLHLESHVPKNFTLSQFFDVWGKQLNPETEWQIFIYINGKPASLQTPLQDQDKIYIGRGK